MIQKVKLCIMMFLQFMLVAVFWVQLSSYLDSINVTGVMFALIMSTMAIGSIFSPMVGMVADRVSNAENVLCVLNAIVAALLCAAYFSVSPIEIFVWLLLAMCVYMPTWSLTATIAMSNSTPDSFPYIRVFGSLGWVCAAGFSLSARWFFDTVIDGTAIPLLCGASVAVIASVFALILPTTPPRAKGEKMTFGDALGLKAFGMLKDMNIAVFMLCMVVWGVAFTIYWMYGSFLRSLGVENITPVLNVGQISELLFMLLVPLSVRCIGFKNTMSLGIIAMLARYVMSAFASDCSGLYWGAIGVHGIIFGFFFVVAQMYIDKKAAIDIKAQAQGMFFFFYGIAQIVGTFFSKWLIDLNTSIIAGSESAKNIPMLESSVNAVATTNWQSVFMTEAAISAVLLVVFYLFFKNDVKSA